MKKDFHKTESTGSNSNSIRVMAIRREFTTNQLSVCEFFCPDLENVEIELRKRYSLDMDKYFISPILNVDEASYSGLLDMEFWQKNEGFVPRLIDGFSYRVIIDSYKVAPRNYEFAEFPDEF